MSTCINRTVQLEIEIGIHAHDLLRDISARHLSAANVTRERGKLKLRLRVSFSRDGGTGGREGGGGRRGGGEERHRIMMKLRERESGIDSMVY